MDHDKAEVFATTWAAAGPETVEKFRQRTLSPQKVTVTETYRKYLSIGTKGTQ